MRISYVDDTINAEGAGRRGPPGGRWGGAAGRTSWAKPQRGCLLESGCNIERVRLLQFLEGTRTAGGWLTPVLLPYCPVLNFCPNAGC